MPFCPYVPWRHWDEGHGCNIPPEEVDPRPLPLGAKLFIAFAPIVAFLIARILGLL